MKTEYLNNKVFESIINRFQESKKTKNKYDLLIEDLSVAFARKATRNSNTEADDNRLKETMEKRDDAVREFGESQEHLAVAFYTLSENIVRYARFNLIDDDDAVQEGVMICFEKIDRFDARKGKAFNYMTTCILNNFRQLYRTARNYNELKKKYHNHCQLKMKPLPGGKNRL